MQKAVHIVVDVLNQLWKEYLARFSKNVKLTPFLFTL